MQRARRDHREQEPLVVSGAETEALHHRVEGEREEEKEGPDLADRAGVPRLADVAAWHLVTAKLLLTLLTMMGMMMMMMAS